jgi:two-component system LytT family sensor kinase
MTATTKKTAAWRRWVRLTLIALAIWLAVCVVDCLWYFGMLSAKGLPSNWIDILRANIPYWILAALLTPPVVWVTRRASFERGRRLRAIAAHLAGVVAFTILHVSLFEALLLAGKPSAPGPAQFLALIPKFVAAIFDKELLVYGVIAGGVLALDYYGRYRERARAAAALEIERAQLRASLSEAKLQALQMQLQPHFLFNALHAVSTLILRGDSRAANRMLSRLSEFLRLTLDGSSAPVVPLATELEFLDAYLRIQEARFGDRLRVVTEIEPGALAAGVPQLILQPLVENAVRHGIGADPGAGTIRVRATVRDRVLRLEVEDDGAGLPEGGPAREGLGIANIRARLAQLYPEAHSFTLGPCAPRGARAEITLPFGEIAGNRGATSDMLVDDGLDSHPDRR